MNSIPLHCCYKWHVCVMVQDTRKPTRYGFKWVYIKADKWYRMTEQEKQRYII